MNIFSRRAFLQTGLQTGVALGAGCVAAGTARAADDADKARPFTFCFNTSTIREQKVGIVREVQIAADAGYDAIEPWLGTIDEYVKAGGSLDDLRKRIADYGVSVESAIGFAHWIVDDDADRAKGLEQMKRDMDTVAKIGGKRIAAPPAGANDKPSPDLAVCAKRYKDILEIGSQIGVVPQVELWGFSKTLSRLEETAYVALASGHPQACMLLDMYHLYKGGSSLSGLRLVAGSGMHVFHFNDYPADPPRDKITDAHRVFPGDGVAPISEVLRTLRDTGYRGCLSLEVFNREYWRQDPQLVARVGLEKMRAAVANIM